MQPGDRREMQVIYYISFARIRFKLLPNTSYWETSFKKFFLTLIARCPPHFTVKLTLWCFDLMNTVSQWPLPTGFSRVNFEHSCNWYLKYVRHLQIMTTCIFSLPVPLAVSIQTHTYGSCLVSFARVLRYLLNLWSFAHSKEEKKRFDWKSIFVFLYEWMKYIYIFASDLSSFDCSFRGKHCYVWRYLGRNPVIQWRAAQQQYCTSCLLILLCHNILKKGTPKMTLRPTFVRPTQWFPNFQPGDFLINHYALNI